MLYTSGTTGKPKGVPRSHRADRAGGLSQVVHQGYRYGDRTLGCMPLYHTMGIHSLVAMHLIGGCYVCQPDWDAGAALELIERERITSLYLAPTLYHDLVTHPRLGEHDLCSVETIAYAGAAMTSALVERCVEAFTPRLFVNHYGSTEIYTYSIHRDQAAKPGCAGRPALNARLRLGENGEILCHMSSDEAFAGYWNRPDADEKAIRDGWYHTGDVGRLDEDGDLWLDGRLDDMIVSRRRERAPARGRGRPRAPSGRARGRRRRRARRPARPSRRRGRRRRGDRGGARRALPRLRHARPLQAPTRVPLRRRSFRRARLGRSCAGCCDDRVRRASASTATTAASSRSRSTTPRR